MSRARSSSITLALYPLPKGGDLSHPLLWSDMPEDLPELTEEEAATLTWDQVVEPTGPEFDHKKLMAILAMKNNPVCTPKRVTFSDNVLDDSSTSDSDEPSVSDCDSEDDFSDSGSQGSEDLDSERSSDEEDCGQELYIDHKLSVDDLTPKISKIELCKALKFTSIDHYNVEVCQ
ncbi:hypothetical protein C0991_005318 [Blastosporella zonata]|nr:hypothetical protein C0991_005318 [Blastosporella zonata]